MFTRADVINQALRRLNLVAEDEQATGDTFAYASRTLDGIAGEIAGELGEALNVEAVEAARFAPMANLLAVDVAPAYGLGAPDTRGRAWARLMATLRSDDREDIPDRVTFY